MSNVVPLGAERPQTIEEEFETFWRVWPHRVAKGAARKAYATARKKASARDILVGVQRYISNKPSWQHYCGPAVYLNQERWLDEPAEPRGSPVAFQVVSSDHAQWRMRIKSYKATKFWPSAFGPPPTSVKCRCPASILREFGL